MANSSSRYPIEPRGLAQAEAAAYVGVTVGAFMKLVTDGRMPVPKRVGLHVLWDRQDIDRYFDALRSDLPDMEAWRSMLKAAFGDQVPPAAEPAFRSAKKAEHWYDLPPGPEQDKRRAKEEAEDRAEIRKRPMDKWERVALWELYRRRGKLVHADLMRRVTFRTHEALHARGYVSVRRNKHGQVEYWQITDRGIAAVKEIPEEEAPSLRPDK